MGVEKALDNLETNTKTWIKAIQMRQHRDEWRRYAYTGKRRPGDSFDSDGQLGPTYIDVLKKQLDKTTAMLITFMKREKEIIGSEGSPFIVDSVLLDRAQAVVDANMEHL